jgi:hypothetical protein
MKLGRTRARTLHVNIHQAYDGDVIDLAGGLEPSSAHRAAADKYGFDHSTPPGPQPS